MLYDILTDINFSTLITISPLRQLFVLYDSLPEPSVKKMQNVVNTAMNIVSAIYLLVSIYVSMF